MKKVILLTLTMALLSITGCSKDEMTGSATINDSDYDITLAEAYFWYDVDNWSNTELILWTSYTIEDGEMDGEYLYIDLYWDGEVRDWLREGTYTLGGDVLDQIAFDSYDNPADAANGTLTITSSKKGYEIVFSGTDTSGKPMKFNYNGEINFLPM